MLKTLAANLGFSDGNDQTCEPKEQLIGGAIWAFCGSSIVTFIVVIKLITYPL
jgi:hypothetical protein